MIVLKKTHKEKCSINTFNKLRRYINRQNNKYCKYFIIGLEFNPFEETVIIKDELILNK